MSKGKLSMMAHLMRRAGFGATRDELETRLTKGYEATVEELLNPDEVEPVPRGTRASDRSACARVTNKRRQ